MAHIVCITGGLTGIFNASLALVEQLQQAGHNITYASPANFRDRVTTQGISYVQLDPWVIQSGDPPLSRWAKLRTIGKRQKRAVEALGVQNFGETMQKLNPDLLLIDMEMHPHIMTAVVNQFPVALLCQFLSIWKRPNLPPIHSNILPGKTWRGKWYGIEWTWLRYGWTKWQEYQRERWRRMGIDRLSVLRCYARQIGYPFQEKFGFTQWLVPYPHNSLPILCFNALELDFPHEPHPLMHYVGAMVCENRQESRIEPHTYLLLEKLFKNRHSSGRSLIYCACSTFVKAEQKFLRQVIDAVASCPQWDLVLGLGGQIKPSSLGLVPPNVYAFSWVPQLQVLKHADCAINNGGINSINECIYFGVPMLVYSLKCFDQDGNAARIEYHHLGITGDRARDDSVQIRHYLQTLLTDRSYQTQVNLMGDCFRRYSQASHAVRVVEALLKAQK